MFLGKKMFGTPYLACCDCDQTLDKWTNGWMDGWMGYPPLMTSNTRKSRLKEQCDAFGSQELAEHALISNDKVII